VPPPTTAAPTAGIAPTRILVTPSATLPRTPTPTATVTPGAAAEINFSVSDDDIAAGECVVLRWDVKNIQAVYLNGSGVVGKGEREVCPSSTTEYTLRVVKLDGTEDSRTVTVRVRQQPTEPPTVTMPTAPPQPSPTTAVEPTPPVEPSPTAGTPES
jgi:hypothetical protein